MCSDAFKPRPVVDKEGNEVAGLMEIDSQKVNKVRNVTESSAWLCCAIVISTVLWISIWLFNISFLFCDRAVEMLISVAETPLVERKKLLLTTMPKW